MRAIVATAPGGPEVLELSERPDPVPGPGEIVVRVRAAGVNRADVLQRRGLYPPPRGASDVLGLECAGEVESVAPDVTSPRPGDRVFAILAGGGYAERVALPASVAMPIPAGLDVAEAGAVPEVFATAYDNLVRVGRMAAGDLVLVHGGGSGVGTAAIQLARQRGARVLVTVGSQEKAARCLTLGAEAAFVYRDEDFSARVKAHTEGRGVDVILDIVGGTTLAKNVESLAEGGRLVIIGAMGGIEGTLPVGRMLTRRLTVQATTLRSRPVDYKAALARALEAEVLPRLAEGALRPIVDRTFPLAAAADAHRLMESSAHFGKIVLLV
jgi:putative PIG3 family NAD(P)H quinone oxidoreductase